LLRDTAARQLVERLCGNSGIPLFILHDFDKAGLTIASTLQRDTRRYQFSETIRAIDLGLRLDDVTDLDLEDSAERVSDKGSQESRAANLRQNGATDDEVDFLLDRRVELNALRSDQLVRFVEQKLMDNGVRKIVPEVGTLAEA
jgi:DNA topoisomerase VI subunit A